MRGKYHMMDWEEEKWIVSLKSIISQLAQDKSYEEDLTNYDVCPANIRKTLENMGWKKIDFDDNGWEHDTWYTFHNINYDFDIILFYCGETFEIKLYRADIDD